jgi:diadenosine tetraphosphate (Ap4A) HIT family hydrolase
MAGCELCEQEGGIPVFRNEALRVIRAQDADHPAFYRVIWNAHVAEWTDLPPPDRSRIMQAVAKVEGVLRESLKPTKVNLASLGNVVPHLHWHVIARFDWEEVDDATSRLALPLPQLDERVASALRTLG